VQTFLPYASFTESARVLDYKRLGKQRVEVKQILNALDGNSKGWTNHPATNMWRGYEAALALYGVKMCQEWILRGYKDSLLPEFQARFARDHRSLDNPAWLGDARLHISHQSNLIRKDPTFYQPIFGDVPSDIPYFWWSQDTDLIK
jgi:hypothetical protein